MPIFGQATVEEITLSKRVTPFPGAVPQIMSQRVDTRCRHVRIVGKVTQRAE